MITLCLPPTTIYYRSGQQVFSQTADLIKVSEHGMFIYDWSGWDYQPSPLHESNPENFIAFKDFSFHPFVFKK